MTITEVRDTLKKEDPHELFKLHHAWVSTLIPFWRQAVIRIAELTGTPTDRRDKHLRAIEQSMTLLPGWRSKQITYVKARRREIDSAPFAWVYDEDVWTREIPNLSKELHDIAQRAFHQR